MGYCLTVLFRIYGPKVFIKDFLESFTWRGRFNHVCQERCDEYRDAYEDYAVHHKYYRDETHGSMADKKTAVLSSLSSYHIQDKASTHFGDLADIILSMSESECGEICYLFPIWKDNLLVPLEWSSEKCGAAWNIKRVFQDLLKEYPDLKQSLKPNKQFRLSMNIIENHGRIYDHWDEDKLFAFLTATNVDLSEQDFADYAADRDVLPVWKTAYPVIKVRGRKIGFTKRNTFDNKDWIDDTQEIKEKLERMNNDTFENGKKVVLKGLESKPQWNGLDGAIVDDYNFQKERWVVNVPQLKRSILIKTCNLKLR